MPKLRDANFTYLLIGLLVTLLVGPVSDELTAVRPGLIIQISFAATLLIGIWSLVESRTWFRIGLTLAIAEPIVTLLDLLRPSLVFEQLALVIALAFLSLSLVIAMRHMFSAGRIDANRIVGAVCVYLLLGVLLSILNLIVYRLLPRSFDGIAANGDVGRGLDLIYYSFVTMTTLGYGDITPVGPLARALAYLGAVMGQFYIAILVGMVVGIYLSEKRRAH